MADLLIRPTHLLLQRHVPFHPTLTEKACRGLFALLWAFRCRPTFEYKRTMRTTWESLLNFRPELPTHTKGERVIDTSSLAGSGSNGEQQMNLSLVRRCRNHTRYRK